MTSEDKKKLEILVDGAAKESELPEMDDSLPCPECNSHLHIDTGFGLAGGGYGPYTYCTDCGCVVSKSCEPCE